jgi:hypothetical protein
MGPGAGAGTYQAVLDRGLHIGAVCSTDNWGKMPGRYGHGTMACLAPELTRESLWEAFLARRVYGVTGDRIRLDFRVNDSLMGQCITAGGTRSISVAVTGWDALDRVEVLRNGRVIATHSHQGTWKMPAVGERSEFRMRVECGWGPSCTEVDVPDRRWEGELRVEGGAMGGYHPCWVSPGQSAPRLREGTAEFSIRSGCETARNRVHNALIFSFVATPESSLRLRLDGRQVTGTVGDFSAQSRLLTYENQSIAMLEERAGIEPGSPERNDIYHFMSGKAKVHPAMPRAAYEAKLEFEDEEALTGEVNYRVRVQQRNGQMAWSSPIWVAPTA